MARSFLPPTLRPTLLSLLAFAVLAGCAGPAPAPVEGAPPTPTVNAYAPLAQSPIRGLTADEIDAYATGKGASLALPAELNGYPGPTHALDLGERLELRADQVEALEALRESMRAQAIENGTVLLALHKALDDGFRHATLDEGSLAEFLDEIAQKEADLRYVHLITHFHASAILTPHQNALYLELRGYGRGAHDAHEH